MRYLSKSYESGVLKQGWKYTRNGNNNKKIRKALLAEQNGFCAYTEDYIPSIDGCDVEHFDDRLKYHDDYWNWYTVLPGPNRRKKKIKDFLPILLPYDSSVPDRIQYKYGIFQAVDKDDIEAQNLIKFLGFNDPIVVQERTSHVLCLQDIRKDPHYMDDGAFIKWFKNFPQNLRLITALEAELGLSLT